MAEVPRKKFPFFRGDGSQQFLDIGALLKAYTLPESVTNETVRKNCETIVGYLKTRDGNRYLLIQYLAFDFPTRILVNAYNDRTAVNTDKFKFFMNWLLSINTRDSISTYCPYCRPPPLGTLLGIASGSEELYPPIIIAPTANFNDFKYNIELCLTKYKTRFNIEQKQVANYLFDDQGYEYLYSQYLGVELNDSPLATKYDSFFKWVMGTGDDMTLRLRDRFDSISFTLFKDLLQLAAPLPAEEELALAPTPAPLSSAAAQLLYDQLQGEATRLRAEATAAAKTTPSLLAGMPKSVAARYGGYGAPAQTTTSPVAIQKAAAAAAAEAEAARMLIILNEAQVREAEEARVAEEAAVAARATANAEAAAAAAAKAEKNAAAAALAARPLWRKAVNATHSAAASALAACKAGISRLCPPDYGHVDGGRRRTQNRIKHQKKQRSTRKQQRQRRSTRKQQRRQNK